MTATAASELEVPTLSRQPRPRIRRPEAAGRACPEAPKVFNIDMQRCPNCGVGGLKIIAAILERPMIEKILTHLGLDPQPPPRGRTHKAAIDFAT